MKRLFLDLELCQRCPECKVKCSYFYHPENNGIVSLREHATFATLCRHCEEAPCVKSCYRNALERAGDGHLRRWRMRCTSCKSCTLACPFGVILPEVIPYLDNACDYCLAREEVPLCVRTCSVGAVQLREDVKEDIENDIYLVGEYLAVHTRMWRRQDILPQKKARL